MSTDQKETGLKQGTIDCVVRKDDFFDGTNTFDFVPKFERDAMYQSDGETLFLC